MGITAKIRYSWIFGWSFAALLIERLWIHFWQAISLTVFYAALGLAGILQMFGGKAHVIALLFWFAGTVFLAIRYGRSFRLPTRTDTDRAIERQSRLPHRPLDALRDQPAGMPDDEARALWNRELHRLDGIAARLRIYLPRPDMARRDRHALRIGAMLTLVIGLVMAGNDASLRMAQSFRPDITLTSAAMRNSFDAWIVAPDYTGAAPVFLASTQQEKTNTAEARAPQGSILKIRAAGSRGRISAQYDGKKQIFARDNAGNHTLEIPLETSGTLVVRQGFRKLLATDIEVIPDTPPAVDIVLAGTTPQAGLQIDYKINDDYGARRLTGIITPDNYISIPGENVMFDIPLAASSKELRSHRQDLTSHILAGLPAVLMLAAQDDAGNVTLSKPYRFILPERKFTNPSAQRIIQERKRLYWLNNPLATRLAGDAFADVANHPEYYKGDIVTFLSLVVAVKRLAYDGDDEAIRTVSDLLWNIALKLEDGGLSHAARELKEALQELSSALNDKNMSDSQIQELADAVSEKMREYMQALASEMQQRMAEGRKTSTIPPELAQKFMQHIDMEELMAQLRGMSEGSKREQMQKMAEFFKNALENLDTQKMAEMNEAQEKAMEALQDMQRLITRQQELIDRTNKIEPGEQTSEEKAEQEDLRNQLGEIARKIAEIMPELPENLSKADQAMKKAAEMLGRNDAKGSLPAQKEALAALQEGMDQAISEMAKGMQQMILSFGAMPQGSSYGEGFDPLGREDGKGQSSEDILIPEEKERRRVQQIIEELRTRSNDYQRPKVERDYIERLLNLFY